MNKPAGLKARILRADAGGLGVVAALTAAAYVVGVEPVINIQARIDEKERLIEEQLRIAADAEQLLQNEQGKLAELKRQLSVSSVQLAPVTDINRRLDRISRLVEDHGLTIQTLDPGTAQTDPSLGKFSMVPIRIAGSGSFQGVTGFLHELLSKAFQDLEVRMLSFSAPPPHDPGSEFAADKAAFTLELRWFAAPADSAGAAPVR